MRRAILAAALLAGGCGGGEDGGPRQDAGAKRGWQRIEPGGRTACARSGRFAFWVRRGRPDRLLVYFQPGGGCFDERTCAPGSPWFDDAVTAEDDPAYQGGVFDLARAGNPFRSYTIVYIPSCTGDVHTGDKVTRYGSVVVRHRGWVNARAALAWAFREVRAPRRVFVAGCSAGSVGSAFHAPAILSRYPRAAVTQLGDSLAFLFHRPISLADYGAHRRFPPFFRIGARRFTMVEYLTALARRFPRRTFARFNFAEDDVQRRFYEAVGGDPDDFEPRLRAAERTLHRRLRNYRSYTACGSSHCVLPLERFYTLRVGGVRVRDWVARLAAGKDVKCGECRR